jgi:hypothetical protein
LLQILVSQDITANIKETKFPKGIPAQVFFKYLETVIYVDLFDKIFAFLTYKNQVDNLQQTKSLPCTNKTIICSL